MSRDSKSSPRVSLSHGAPAKHHGSTVLGIVIGVVIGVLIAFALVWYMNRATMPFQDKTNRNGDKTAAAKPAPAPAAPGAATPEPLPGKPGDKPVEKPRFEFYNILPGKQDAAPDHAPAPAAAAPAAPEQTTYLQVGAFQKPADADNLKAKLALIGVEASVQQITIADKGTLHRVRTGPYTKLDDMNKVRTLLSQNGIQATVVKGGN
ncbi:hypothetical protein DLREEDagrD3_15000 [Denitratisoma sp. agr-D3]